MGRHHGYLKRLKAQEVRVVAGTTEGGGPSTINGQDIHPHSNSRREDSSAGTTHIYACTRTPSPPHDTRLQHACPTRSSSFVVRTMSDRGQPARETAWGDRRHDAQQETDRQEWAGHSTLATRH